MNLENNIHTNNEMKILHNKDNIILTKNTIDESYNLKMIFNSNKITLQQIYNFNLYYLLFELNKDILENVDVKELNETTSNVTLLFKQFGMELGIPQKYMCLSNKKEYDHENNKIVYIGEDLSSKLKINDGEKVTVHHSKLLLTKKDNTFYLNYDFNVDIHENLPLFMENLIGTLIKNIFIRFKHFIESYK